MLQGFDNDVKGVLEGCQGYVKGVVQGCYRAVADESNGLLQISYKRMKGYFSGTFSVPNFFFVAFVIPS